MTEPSVPPAEAPPPIVVTMVGPVDGSTTGDRRGAPITTGTIATTPDHMPNVVFRVISPLVSIAIRFAYAYGTSLLGLITVGLTSKELPAADFGHLVLKCASLAFAPPCVALVKDVITLLGDLEKKYPLLTGNV